MSIETIADIDYHLRHTSEQLFPFLSNLVEKIGAVQLIHRLANFDASIGESGLSNAATSLAESLNFQLNATSRLDQLPRSGPAIIVSNHDSRLEPLWLWALLGRNDISLLGGTESLKMGPNTSAQVIPIKPRKYANQASLLYGHSMTLDAITQMNNQAFSASVDRLTGGQGIGIFPSGGRKSIREPWYQGIGNMIGLIPRAAMDTISLITVYFSGFSKYDFSMMLWEYARKGRANRQRPIIVKIGTIKPLSCIVKSNTDPRAITEAVRAYYLNQFALGSGT